MGRVCLEGGRVLSGADDENERESEGFDVGIVNQGVRPALKRMKNGKALVPDDIHTCRGMVDMLR